MMQTLSRCFSLLRAVEFASAPLTLLLHCRHHHQHHHLLRQTLTSLHTSPSFSAFAPRFSRTKAPCCFQKQVNQPLSQQGNIARDDGVGSNYFDPSFWDTTYAKDPEPLEWYQSYAQLSPLVRKYIPTSSRVLMAGCGNSVLSEDMVKDGYSEIVNIDISPVVIEAMQKKYHNVPQLKYMTMDVLDLSSFDDCTFDCVIDKGTLDAIMCVAGGPYNVAMMLAEISRILKRSGVYMLITFAGPQMSLPLINMDAFGWTVSLYIIPEPGSKKALEGCSKAYSEPVLLNSDGTYANNLVLEDADSLFIYVCTKQP